MSPGASQEDAKVSEVSRARRGGRSVKAESPQGKDFHRVRQELVSGTNFGAQFKNAHGSVGLQVTSS